MHILIIESTPSKLKPFRWKLFRMGFKKETSGRYIGSASKNGRINRIRNFCKENKLKFRIDNSYGKRSGNYRKVFLENFPPNASDKAWYCSYCGKKIKEHKLVVDHLYPIYEVSRNLKLQAKLRNQGISNVNSPENLVPSCFSCNSKKGAKMGLWLLRGKIGSYGMTWVIFNYLKLFFLCYMIYIFFNSGMAKAFYNYIVDFLWLKYNYVLPKWY